MLRMMFLYALIPTFIPYFCFKLQRKALPKQLTPFFSIEFGAPIWDVRSNGRYILVSERNDETQQVLFSLFDLTNQSFVWDQISFEEEWWVRLVFLGEEVAVFQTFNDTQDIEVQSIFVVNLLSLEVLWQKEGCRFVQASDASVKLLDAEEKELALDLRTGEAKAYSDISKLHEIITYPAYYNEGSQHFNTLKQFVTKQVSGECSGSFEYYQNNEVFIISANIEGETGYLNQLFVFNTEGELLFQEILEEELKGLASGTFFIVNRELIFVKGKKELLAYSI